MDKIRTNTVRDSLLLISGGYPNDELVHVEVYPTTNKFGHTRHNVVVHAYGSAYNNDNDGIYRADTATAVMAIRTAVTLANRAATRHNFATAKFDAHALLEDNVDVIGYVLDNDH